MVAWTSWFLAIALLAGVFFTKVICEALVVPLANVLPPSLSWYSNELAPHGGVQAITGGISTGLVALFSGFNSVGFSKVALSVVRDQVWPKFWPVGMPLAIMFC